MPTIGAQPISGFASGPGVLQYRVGDKVYKQIPVREGKYQIGSEFLSEVPRGGRLEFVGLDGLPREVAIPSMLSTSFGFYRPGDYSFDVGLGRLNGADGGHVYASAGGRYGLSRNLTAELGLSGTDRAYAATATLNWRLPGPLGALRASGAVSGDWNGGSPIGSTVEANYTNRFKGLSFDLSHRRNFNGGYEGLGQTAALLLQSKLLDTSRVSLGFNIPLPGDDLSVRVMAERSRYAGLSDDNHALQVDLGRGFGRLGNGFVLGRYGRDQYGQGYSSIMLNWIVPLGRRMGASANFASNDSDGHGRENRYSATLWGSSAGANGLGGNYQVSIDQDQRIAADGNYRTRMGTFAASLSRQPGERPFGSLAMRGGLVAAGGGVTATRSISDSVLVVRAKELARSNIYIPPDLEGRTRFDGAGRGVLTDLAPYRQFNLSFDQSALPLGVEITQTGLKGSVRPYRGYVVKIPVRQLRPVRVFAKIPSDAFAKGNAIAGQDFAPIEMDGSIYFSSWPQSGTPVVLTWQTENGPHSCVLDLPPAPPEQAAGKGFDPVELRDVACNPKEDN